MAPLMKSLFVVVALTLAPVQAWAECAWVLWTEISTLGDASPNTWRLVSALRSEATCEVALAAELDRYRGGVKPEFRQYINTTVESNEVTWVTGKGQITTWTYRCLPDTVDPRGPKGGGR